MAMNNKEKKNVLNHRPVHPLQHHNICMLLCWLFHWQPQKPKRASDSVREFKIDLSNRYETKFFANNNSLWTPNIHYFIYTNIMSYWTIYTYSWWQNMFICVYSCLTVRIIFCFNLLWLITSFWSSSIWKDTYEKWSRVTVLNKTQKQYLPYFVN